ncbi:hypothetical protein [Parafrankia sp. EAN1pec]
MSTRLTLDDVDKSHDHRLVVRAASCALPAGQRAGTIGENASG